MSETVVDTLPLTVVTETEDSKLLKFSRQAPDASFTLPKVVTVRQQLAYYSALSDNGQHPTYVRLWQSARTLMRDWECAVLPDTNASIDSLTDAAVTTVIMWAGNQVLSYIESLDALPKV